MPVELLANLHAFQLAECILLGFDLVDSRFIDQRKMDSLFATKATLNTANVGPVLFVLWILSILVFAYYSGTRR